MQKHGCEHPQSSEMLAGYRVLLDDITANHQAVRSRGRVNENVYKDETDGAVRVAFRRVLAFEGQQHALAIYNGKRTNRMRFLADRKPLILRGGGLLRAFVHEAGGIASVLL